MWMRVHSEKKKKEMKWKRNQAHLLNRELYSVHQIYLISFPWSHGDPNKLTRWNSWEKEVLQNLSKPLNKVPVCYWPCKVMVVVTSLNFRVIFISWTGWSISMSIPNCIFLDFYNWACSTFLCKVFHKTSVLNTVVRFDVILEVSIYFLIITYG